MVVEVVVECQFNFVSNKTYVMLDQVKFGGFLQTDPQIDYENVNVCISHMQ